MTEKAPGRYCLAICYCGDCPHYKPLRAAQITSKTDTRQAQAWDEREEGSTWIDQL